MSLCFWRRAAVSDNILSPTLLKGIDHCLTRLRNHHLPMQETQVESLGQEDPLEKENGNPLQYSCLENSMDRGAWRATVHGVAKA